MTATRLFRNRHHAGHELARRLLPYRCQSPLIFALPRGGVPVAFETAEALGAPLDVWIVRRLIGHGPPEVALGAVAEGGEPFVDPQIVHSTGVSVEQVQAAIRHAAAEAVELSGRCRRGLPVRQVAGRTVIVVDDGVASGATARAALRALRRGKPRRLVLAVPVGCEETLASLHTEADEIVCLSRQDDLVGVDRWYQDYRPVDDDEVGQLLHRARAPGATSAPLRELDGRIDTGEAMLSATFAVPAGARGCVVVVPGAGSSRDCPSTVFLAEALHQAGFATLLFDMLSEDEEAQDENDGHLRYDVALFARRLLAVIEWTRNRVKTRLPIGLFGRGNGAAAALIAAAQRPDAVGAVVSRGGRPDLALPWLARVRAPTLLLVGGDDPETLQLNRRALEALGCPKGLSVVPHATNLFEEPGALEQVSRLADDWFRTHLPGPPGGGRSSRPPAPALRTTP
jgi:putative phosphoribosyl transferase